MTSGGGTDGADAIVRSVADCHQLAFDPDGSPFRRQDGPAQPQLLTGRRPAQRRLLQPQPGTQRRPDAPDHRPRSSTNSTILKEQGLAFRLLLFRFA